MVRLSSVRFALIAVSILALASEGSHAATKRKASGAQNQSGKSTSTQSGNRRPAYPNGGTRDRYDPVGKD